MRLLLLSAAFLSPLLSACSREAPQKMEMQSLAAFDVAPSSAPPGIVAVPSSAPPSAGPSIAYTYAVTYDFARATVAAVQARHLRLCRDMGPARCQLVRSTLSNGEPDGIAASETVLLVAATAAPNVNDRLDALAADGGATVHHRETAAEDVTKAIIDTDARVRAKEALAARLLGIINTRAGKVGELVEAERAYADTQEALDAARNERAALAQRVRMSRVDIRYQYNSGSSAIAPLRQSMRDAGDTLAGSAAALITFVIAALPWALLLTGVVWLLRKLRWRPRWWLRRRGSSPAPAD